MTQGIHVYEQKTEEKIANIVWIITRQTLLGTMSLFLSSIILILVPILYAIENYSLNNNTLYIVYITRNTCYLLIMIVLYLSFNMNTHLYNKCCGYCDKLFSSIVNKNESVPFDTAKTKGFVKVSKDATSLTITVYSSIKDNPLTIDDCDELGTFNIPMPKDKQKITIEFIFGQTILTVYAYETGNNQHKKQIKINSNI